MPEPMEPTPLPSPTEAPSPIRKGFPVVMALLVILFLIGVANVSRLFNGHKDAAPQSLLPTRPSSASGQQVANFERQQQLQAQKDAESRQREAELAAAMQQLEQAQAIPGPESPSAPPMTEAQAKAIYGESSSTTNATSNISEARAEAKQREAEAEKRHQDALSSDTTAVDFERAAPQRAAIPEPTAVDKPVEASTTGTSDLQPSAKRPGLVPAMNADAGETARTNASGQRLYRVFEGTVFEGIVTNHLDGGFNGPILVMLTTDYYSHDHQQLLLPQGTRLIGSLQSAGNDQQRKLFVTFHRAICPDGFSIELDKYIGLDPIGTTGLATSVDHGYLEAFAAAAAVGGLGGLAQVGNGGSVLTPSTQVRDGISEQSATEGEQVLNHFLNRLPVITLKEGSRARVYVGADLLLPSYADHRVDPTL